MRIKNPKAKGTRFEHECKKYLESNGMNVYRSPASLGSADLIAISKWHNGSLVQLIQCKYLEKYMSKKETEVLVADATKLGAEAYLFFREKPRGQIMWKLLYSPDIN